MAGPIPAEAQISFSFWWVPDSSPREMKGVPLAAIARKAPGALSAFPAPAGSSGGPRRMKSLYITSRRSTP